MEWNSTSLFSMFQQVSHENIKLNNVLKRQHNMQMQSAGVLLQNLSLWLLNVTTLSDN